MVCSCLGLLAIWQQDGGGVILNIGEARELRPRGNGLHMTVMEVGRKSVTESSRK